MALSKLNQLAKCWIIRPGPVFANVFANVGLLNLTPSSLTPSSAVVMLRQIVRLQLNRIKKRVEARYKIPFDYSEDVVRLVVSRCTESESGGR